MSFGRFSALIVASVAGAVSVGSTALPTQTARVSKSIEDFLQGWVKAKEGPDLNEIDRSARYSTALVDLSGDDRREAVIYLAGQSWCGTGGCTLLVLTPNGSSWRVVNWIPATRPPIRVLRSKTRGWRDLGFLAAGGGIDRPQEQFRRFDGKKYRAADILASKSRRDGSTLISADAPGELLFR